MSEQGIGARVLRKEDKRFITGKGRYTDDIRNERQSYAAFVRSPHAHAKVKSIDTAEAEKMDGVIAVLNGKQLTDDGIGNLICGWAVNSKDGNPMNMAPGPRSPPTGCAMWVMRSFSSWPRRRPRHALLPKPWKSIMKNFRPSCMRSMR
ncbi:carbon-monoxide dehydrogenase large subunit, coxL-like protein [Nitratireductor aquibiodomus RA22]|uniref:Carbon-monoxide dehydrogenase large subunit, coxL-like protein n=1 Tax=Nitratireductor aquibiodomus RA22 TaxID=1189611 RepID=I5C7U6_9HYPH|nr:carbon-monoxide dehydrogenase large subunit, coxL-like protein [Nitratireductor aquibiodomus RA22]